MRILGIETSCDESAVCLIDAEGSVENNFRFQVLGNSLISQIAIHAQYGGVFPNLAKREHAKNLVPLLEKTLEQAGLPRQGLTLPYKTLDELKLLLSREPELYEKLTVFLQKYVKPEIDAIAVTVGPGLEPALWVGVNFARALSLAWDIPIVAVNHMEGHIVVSLMRYDDNSQFAIRNLQKIQMKEVQFPILSLLISGGHTELVLSTKWHEYKILGATRDDAVGEAFDKVARLLGLPYPGGPQISALAEMSRINADKNYSQMNAVGKPTGHVSAGQATKSADSPVDGLRKSASNLQKSAVILPRPMLHDDTLDFSFAGLKTAVLRIVESNSPLSDEMKMDIAREFEDAVTDVLVSKTMKAVDAYGIQTVVVGGGVSANSHIRAQLAEQLTTVNCKLLTPPIGLATDNAIMIALAGYFRAVKNEFADTATLRANGNLKLA